MLKKLFAPLAVSILLMGGVAALPTRAATHSGASMTNLHATLQMQAFSGVSGTATLSYDAMSKMTTVKLVVKHLEPGTSHPAHIHSGTCSSNGPVIAALTTVKAGMNGTGTSTTVVAGSFANKKAYINVHLGPGLALTGYTVLACGQLTSGM